MIDDAAIGARYQAVAPLLAHAVSHETVAQLLREMGYSLQSNRKTLEGTSHPDRDAQFRHIHAAVQLQLSLGEPVISVDTKKKEFVGPFRNGDRELRPRGDPELVLMHDFVIDDRDRGRVSPMGCTTSPPTRLG